MSAPIQVSAASVSDLKGGDRMLLLRTDAGFIRFLVPSSVAAGIFRITNPTAPALPRPHAQITKPLPEQPAPAGASGQTPAVQQRGTVHGNLL